uniref:L-type lectin-like domain-containing protein n=1 Tax=Steinernema glaseri TaxID=37863 RepID=A0A1I7ZA56_9BILA
MCGLWASYDCLLCRVRENKALGLVFDDPSSIAEVHALLDSFRFRQLGRQIDASLSMFASSHACLAAFRQFLSRVSVWQLSDNLCLAIRVGRLQVHVFTVARRAVLILLNISHVQVCSVVTPGDTVARVWLHNHFHTVAFAYHACPSRIMTLTVISAAMACVLLLSSTLAQDPVMRKFEYKHSFRAPNLAQRDGSIPFWMITGDAIASEEQLRLAPSMRSRKGIAWNKRPMVESEHFEIDMSFKITGQGRIGADGLAIWYTAQQGTLGPVFGSNDYWTGMGLMFDSFDNDGQKNNPFVALMINDGTRSYDHQTDGSQQMLSGCQRDFRNKPFPVRVKVQYYKNVLTVLMHDGMTPQPRYELCIRAENIFLPRNGYFGISAATGGLADDHDVTDFSVYSLFAEQRQQPQQHQMPVEEKQKYDAEFERQMQDFEKERQKFKEEHPEKVKDEEDLSKYFEDATARELRLIYESQTAIHQVMQQMEAKLREISQQQNVHTSMLQQGGAVAQPGGAPPAQGTGIMQHEKNEMLQSLRDLTSSLRDMKNYVNEIFTRSYNIEQKLTQGGAGGAAQQDPAIKAYLESIQNDIRHMKAQQQVGANKQLCDNIPCLSSTVFMMICIVQSAVILVFVYIRSKSDKAKFY